MMRQQLELLDVTLPDAFSSLDGRDSTLLYYWVLGIQLFLTSFAYNVQYLFPD